MIYIVQGRDITIIGDAGQQVGVMIDKYENEEATLDAALRMADFCGGTVITADQLDLTEDLVPQALVIAGRGI